MTKRRILVGLIGRNIQGSLSPALFADAFEAAGIDGYYHLMDVDRMPGRQLPQLLDAIKVAGFAGANVTYPFKQEIIPLLDAVDPEAAQVGAVNTVVIALDGHTTGYNFDRPGWRNSFAASLGADSARGATVVQVGAGGAGRAVAFALMDLGVAHLVLHDLDKTRVDALKADVAKHCGPDRCRVGDDLPRDIAAADGVVNATQVGMSGFPETRYPWPRSSQHIGPPTSSIRRSKPNSSKPRPVKVRASWAGPACACIRPSKPSDSSPASHPMLRACMARLPKGWLRATRRWFEWTAR